MKARFSKESFPAPSGIDPYSSAVSDVYQDLFQEGSYTGKGIYDIDAFEAALAGKVPENALLSHDLFEGIFARVALATTSSCLKNSPRIMRPRPHGSIAGRAETGNFCLGFSDAASASAGKSRPVSIPAIGRWKMLDNLAPHSVGTAPCFLHCIAGWLLTPSSPWVWTSFILADDCDSSPAPFSHGLNPRRSGISMRSHFRGVLSDLSLGASLRSGLTFTFLAYQTWLMSDAILRTLVRLFVTRRNLLEWVTAAQAKLCSRFQISSRIYRRMAGGVVLAAGALRCCGRWDDPRLGLPRFRSLFSGPPLPQ